MAAGLMYVLLLLGAAILSYYLYYRVTRAAVRDGVVDALKRTGTGFGGDVMSGYPPPQDYGPPAAPTYRGQ